MPASRRQKLASGPLGEVSAGAGQPPVCPRAFRDRPPLCTPRRVNQLRPKLRPGHLQKAGDIPEPLAETDLDEQVDHDRGPGQLGAPGPDKGEGDQTGKQPECAEAAREAAGRPGAVVRFPLDSRKSRASVLYADTYAYMHVHPARESDGLRRTSQEVGGGRDRTGRAAQRDD